MVYFTWTVAYQDGKAKGIAVVASNMEKGRIFQTLILSYFSILVVLSTQSFIPYVELTGNDTAKSGTGQFTVLNNVQTASIRCIVYNFGAMKNVTLEKDEVVVETRNRACEVGTWCIFVYRDTVSPAGNYSCNVHFLSVESGSPNFSFIFESKIEVFKRQTFDCLASNGGSGLVGESSQLRCEGDGLVWKRNNRSTLYVPLIHYGNSQTCGRYKNNADGDSLPEMWEEVCNTSEFTISAVLHIDISPKTFTNDFEVLEFVCTTHPPRKIFWNIFGTRGDLVGYNNLKYNNVTMTDTNVSIVQTAGWTSVRVTEAVAGGNGIERVVCYTYDTQVTFDTSRLLKTMNDLHNTEMPLSHSPVRNISHKQMVPTDNTPSKPSREAELVYIMIILFLVVGNVTCIVIMLMSHFKILKRNPEKAVENITKDENERGPQSHINPVYRPYEQETSNDGMLNESEYNYIET